MAVNTYFEAPEKVAALILVAPAIFAPLVQKKGNRVGEEKRKGDGDAKVSPGENPFVRVLKGLSMLFKFFVGKVLHIVRGLSTLVLRPLLPAMLVRLWMSPFAIVWLLAQKLLRIVLKFYGFSFVEGYAYDLFYVNSEYSWSLFVYAQGLLLHFFKI